MANRKVLKDRERQRRALNARRRGLTWREVAEQTGYRDASTAFRAAHTMLDRIEERDVEHYRVEELNRIDDAYGQARTTLEAAVEKGDLQNVLRAVDSILKTTDRHTRLLGLNKPERVEVGAADADLDRVMKRVTALLDEKERD